MNILTSDRFGQLARTYWQPLTLSLLALLAFSQVISWGVAAVELNKVDTLIEKTQTVSSGDSNPSVPSTQNDGEKKPGNLAKMESPESENPGQSPGGDRSQIPPKNIFKKEETNYTISAIYLNKAVINGEAVEIGQPVGKAKLKEIRTASVVIEEENGETRTIDMFQGGFGGENPEPSMGGGMTPLQQGGMGRPAMGRVATRTGSSQPMGIPPGITIKGINADRYRNMSSEERNKFRNSLSASDRERLKQQMQQARQSRNR